MDLLILLILRRILRPDSTPARLLLASGAGAAWACATVLWPMPPWVEILMTYAGISALMAAIAFRPRQLGALAREVLGMYLTAACLSGLMYALYYHTSAGYYIELAVRGDAAGAIGLGMWLFMLAGALLGAYGGYGILRSVRNKRCLYQVTLFYQGREEKVTALLDTGNRLREPVTGRPVHILTADACLNLCQRARGVVYIPYQAVGIRHGVLPGIFFDSMEVRQKSQVHRVRKPLIAIIRQPLSPRGEYQMLLQEEW